MSHVWSVARMSDVQWLGTFDCQRRKDNGYDKAEYGCLQDTDGDDWPYGRVKWCKYYAYRCVAVRRSNEGRELRLCGESSATTQTFALKDIGRLGGACLEALWQVRLSSETEQMCNASTDLGG